MGGCYPHESSAYDVRITNESSMPRLAVFANGVDGASILPAYEVPADGVARTNEYVIRIFDTGEGDEKAVVLIYSLDCDLVGTITVSTGFYDIRIGSDDEVAVLRRDRQSNEDSELPYLQESPVRCPGAGPTTAP